MRAEAWTTATICEHTKYKTISSGTSWHMANIRGQRLAFYLRANVSTVSWFQIQSTDPTGPKTFVR